MTAPTEPPKLTPQAMTLEEGLAAIFPDTIGRRDDGKWPFFTYVNDEHGHTCTAVFDTWPEAVSWAKGVPVVARDDAAELRALLNHPLLNKLMGELEDHSTGRWWGMAEEWMDLRDAALAATERSE